MTGAESVFLLDNVDFGVQLHLRQRVLAREGKASLDSSLAAISVIGTISVTETLRSQLLVLDHAGGSQQVRRQ